MRRNKLPSKTSASLNNLGLAHAWEFLRGTHVLPEGYTVWQLRNVILSDACHDFEKDMLIQAGLWETDFEDFIE